MRDDDPARVTIRPYRDDDAAAAVAFLTDAGREDETLVPITEEAWRGFVGRSFNEGGKDFALAEEDGRVAALLMSHRRGDVRRFRIIVHPRARRRGVGTQLLAYVEALDAERVAHEAETVEGWDAGEAFLARAGFAETRRDLEMERRAPPPAPAPLPPDVALRPYAGTPDDDAAWRRLNDEGYRGGPGYSPLSPADLAIHCAAAEFHLWFAERGDEALGYGHTEVWQGTVPYLYSVVVTQAERGTGLGRALTVAGLRTLLERDPERPVSLFVLSDNAPALALYRSLGFREKSHAATWRRDAF